MSAGSKRVRNTILSAVAIAAIAGPAWMYLSYQERVQLRERKTPFAEVVAIALGDGEAVRASKGLPVAGRTVRAGCTFTDPLLCRNGRLRKFSMAEDGAMVLVLSGGHRPELEGKTIVLTPRVANGTVTWGCVTDASRDNVPNPEDHLSIPDSLRLNCEIAKIDPVLQPAAPR